MINKNPLWNTSFTKTVSIKDFLLLSSNIFTTHNSLIHLYSDPILNHLIPPLYVHTNPKVIFSLKKIIDIPQFCYVKSILHIVK